MFVHVKQILQWSNFNNPISLTVSKYFLLTVANSSVRVRNSTDTLIQLGYTKLLLRKHYTILRQPLTLSSFVLLLITIITEKS